MKQVAGRRLIGEYELSGRGLQCIIVEKLRKVFKKRAVSVSLDYVNVSVRERRLNSILFLGK
jgi:hypothetical protein